MKSYWPALLLLALLHGGFALAYSAATPYRQAGFIFGNRTKAPPPEIREQLRQKDIGAPDERQHANYVGRILAGQGFPVFNPSDPNLYESYQAHQPPLYYLLAAGYSRVLGVSDVQTPSDGRRIRSFNAWIGAATVIAAFFLAFWGLGSVRYGLAAASIVALLPMNVALSSAIGNDPLLVCISTWCLALAIRAWTSGWTLPLAAGVGALAGLAIVTKTTGLALIPALIVGLWLSKPRPTAVQFLAATVLGLAIAAPWMIRNQGLYGDPLAIGAFNQAFTGSPQASMFIQAFGQLGYWADWVGWYTARSFVGVFGYMDIFLPASLYRIVLAILFLLLALGATTWSKLHPKPAKPTAPATIAFVVIVLLLFVRFNMQFFQGQARYLMPALGPLAMGMAVGLVGLSKDRWKWALTALVLLLISLNAYVLTVLPAAFADRTFGA